MHLGLPSKTGYEQTNHGNLDQGFAGLHFALVIFAHPPVAR